MATRRTKGATYRDQSEYTGETRRNTILKKPPGSVPIPWEQLRLTYLTGEPLDVTSEPDPRIWQGWTRYPNSVIDFRD